MNDNHFLTYMKIDFLEGEFLKGFMTNFKSTFVPDFFKDNYAEIVSNKSEFEPYVIHTDDIYDLNIISALIVNTIKNSDPSLELVLINIKDNVKFLKIVKGEEVFYSLIVNNIKRNMLIFKSDILFNFVKYEDDFNLKLLRNRHGACNQDVYINKFGKVIV